VRQFTEKEIKPIALARDREEDFDKRFPWEVLAKADKLGLRTLALSEKNGGGGAVEELKLAAPGFEKDVAKVSCCAG
jgi:alkylation response protein AidB-like acyl-CoA dehydrogenase